MWAWAMLLMIPRVRARCASWEEKTDNESNNHPALITQKNNRLTGGYFFTEKEGFEPCPESTNMHKKEVRGTLPCCGLHLGLHFFHNIQTNSYSLYTACMPTRALISGTHLSVYKQDYLFHLLILQHLHQLEFLNIAILSLGTCL